MTELEAKAEAAETAYQQAQSAPPAAPVVDVKQLKTNAAVARTKLKQAEKALAKAQESGADNIAELEARLAEQKAKTEAAQTAYDQAESGSAPAAAPAVNLDELKATADAALAKVEKARQALAAAEASGSPAVDKMRAGVEKLQSKYAEAQAEYDQAAGAGAARPAVDNRAELKADMDALQAKVEKARQALADAEASASPAVEKMRAGVDKLQSKYDAARSEYEQAEAAFSAAPAANAQLDELRSDLEAMQAKVAKARDALEKAIVSGSPAVEKMRAGVDKLAAKQTELEQEYLQAGGERVVEETQPEVDPKALKQQVSIMRTKLKKAQAALEAADPSEQAELQAEVNRLEALHEEAKEAFDAYEQKQVNLAAAEGIDLKQLKIDAAMARAAVTKAERALSKAREENTEELPGIEQQLVAAQQEAEQLNQTLSRFTD